MRTRIRVDLTGTTEGLIQILKAMEEDRSVKGLLVLACEANGFARENVDKALQDIAVPLFGGIFPALIHGAEKIDRGTIVVGLPCTPSVNVMKDISNPSLNFDDELEKFTEDGEEGKTMFVIVDGYSQRLSSLVNSLYYHFGLEYNFIGGGAGCINPTALDMKNTPCLFTNEGLCEDSALLAVVSMESGVSANHGWHKISGPYIVTKTEGNRIQGLDWKPAFEVYTDLIQQHAGETITNDNFFDVAKRFPFGINRLGSEIVVRDPFTVEGDSIILATEVAEESFVDILTGNIDSLIDAAEHSLTTAMSCFTGTSPSLVFVFDCISRALFLDEEFSREIKAVNRENLPLVGCLSLGEIANSGKSFMELYNKTCVVGIFGEK